MNFEHHTPTIDADATEPKTWTVRRSSGELDPGWTEAKRETGPDGVVRVEVTKPAEDGGEYVKTVKLDSLESIARQLAQQDLGEEAVDAANIATPESLSPQPVAPEALAVSDSERESQIRSSQAIIQALKATFDALGLDTVSRSAASVIDEATMQLERVRAAIGYANGDPYGINQETLTRVEALKEDLAKQRHTVSYGMTDYDLEEKIKNELRNLALLHHNLVVRITAPSA